MNVEQKIIVLDGFYENPDAIRAWALSTGYKSVGRYSFPGWQSAKALHNETLMRRFAQIVGRPIQVDVDEFTFGGFRIVTRRTGQLTKVHADTAADWAGLVYLTPDAPDDAGTGFFRHRSSGFERPPTDRQAQALGYADCADFTRAVVLRDSANPDAWELLEWVAPIYNRLILFRGCEFYHAPLGGAGDTVDTGRLSHNFFFNEVPERARVCMSEGIRSALA
jgi:hypothetical protein